MREIEILKKKTKDKSIKIKVKGLWRKVINIQFAEP
jgi:hypothetical protein